VVVVDESSGSSSNNDNEEVDEQVRNHLVANEEAIKFPRRMTAVMTNFVRMDNILRNNDLHLEIGGIITFYPNMVKNGQM
jgi:hypothetical protein